MNNYFALHALTDIKEGKETITEVLFFHSFRSAKDAYIFLFSEFNNLNHPTPWIKENSIPKKPAIVDVKNIELEPVSLLVDISCKTMNELLPHLHLNVPINSLSYITRVTDYLRAIHSEVNDRRLFLSGPVIIPYGKKKYVTLSADKKERFLIAGNFALSDLEEIEMAEKMLFLYGK